ncbi:MAG: class I SAM-dependent methyltransferase [Solirubrobacteraceae bacterium]|jgi:SAM-dependent methyltransferase
MESHGSSGIPAERCAPSGPMVANRPHPSNYAFIVHFLQGQLCNREARVLDFGCGTGDLVRDLRLAGFDAYGADVFYEGASFEQLDGDELLAGGYIRQIGPGDELPFPENFFDAVVSHMVIEHVEDLNAVVDQAHRVLRPGGLAYHQFPTLEVIREGHFGVPLSHRLRPGALRTRYMILARRMGLYSSAVHAETPEAWAAHALAWIDSYCVYRTRREVEASFERRFAIAGRPEVEYCRFRAAQTGPPWLERLLGVSMLKPLFQLVFRRVAFASYHLVALEQGSEQMG